LKLGETPHTFVEWLSSQLLQNTPLHPIAEWGRQRFGGAETPGRLVDLENTLRLVGLDAAEYAPLLAPLVDIPLPRERAAKLAPEDLRRRQLAAMTTWVLAGARSQPAAVVFEDLHWADPTSLDLMQALAERGHQAPLFILATARSEFRPPWSLRSHHTVISLSPLNPAGVALMVGELAARRALSREVVEGVNERTGGVPLFVEEVTRLLLERGEAGGMQAIPPTLQQSLAARLDRLGEAREVAQICAVLGRDFTYSLLRAVGGVDDADLLSALDRLAGAGVLIAMGAGHEAHYSFKHALIQDAAYDSLLKSRRRALHRRVAELLRDQPERAVAEPEVIAHHFNEAGLDDLAIEWWGKAGDQALRRSAFQEAIAHLGKAIALADKTAGGASERGPREAATSSQRQKLQTDYGHAVMCSKGYAANEANAAFARTAELAANTEGPSERFSSSYGPLLGRLLRREYLEAEYIARRLLHEAETAKRGPETAQARNAVGQICLYQGKVHEAQTAFEGALVDWRLAKDSVKPLQLWIDPGVMAASNLAHVAWLVGDPARARRLSDQANQRANESGHAQTRAQTLLLTALFETLRNDPAAAFRSTALLLGLAREHGMELYATFGEVYSAWARSRLTCSRAAAAGLQQAIADYVQQGNRTALPFFLGLLAERQADAEDIGSAIATIDEALARASETGERLADSFLHRLCGDILLKRDHSKSAPGEDAYWTAIAVAKQQDARSYELLASLALAKLYQLTSRSAEAHTVLAPALEGFLPTPEMPEIAEAQTLLATLAETEEVKAAIAHRRRRFQLQVAYGNALIGGRGMGAATEAFARARDYVAGDKGSPERLAIHYGLWAGSLLRGELSEMREHVEAFFSDVEANPDSPEAGVAHRTAGMTHWFAGEYREAREHLERALSLFQPGRDDDLAFLFAQDAGVAAMNFLALTLWPLGGVERARSLVESARTRSASVTHIGTHAYEKAVAAQFELMRGDLVRAAQNGIELTRLARENDLPFWRLSGIFFEGLATAESGALGSGLEDMRRGAELLREQSVLLYDGLLKILLAETEARAGDVDRALGVLDEALATCGRTGYRSFEAELHRVRGEMLLKRDPADPASAEEALQAAIVVANQQGTRSFKLRAALSLAKLYQSTGRPVDAHAVLAPALEGFAPTPEMPEIAEAQALLMALAGTDEVKAAIAQRDRRLHLQTAYGQAVMWSKGYAAEETRAAFARIRELAGGTENAAERFPAYYAQWVRSLFRGEHRHARRTAEAFLREAEEDGSITEAGVARRCLGLTCLNHGDLMEARTLLERALADYRPNRDAEALFHFGLDSGVAAAAWLASATWHLGEVKRARQLAEQAVRSAAELGHVPSRALAYFVKTGLETNCGHPAAALRSAETLLALARGHGMDNYIALGEAYGVWARGRLDDPEASAEALRRVLAGNFAQGNRNLAPLFHGWLAELEAATRGPDAALTLIDQGLEIAEKTGERLAESYLHRLRGAALLKRDPESHAAAEQSFQTAITIARRQGARSWGLLASLALAKLYQSTNRPSDACAVLEPALEGFAPTPEMPEIAEAQGLLATLVEPDEVRNAAAARQRGSSCRPPTAAH
jgi:predicted ATPase